MHSIIFMKHNLHLDAKLFTFKGAAMNDSWDVSDKTTYTPFILKKNSNRTCSSVIENMYDNLNFVLG